MPLINGVSSDTVKTAVLATAAVLAVPLGVVLYAVHNARKKLAGVPEVDAPSSFLFGNAAHIAGLSEEEAHTWIRDECVKNGGVVKARFFTDTFLTVGDADKVQQGTSPCAGPATHTAVPMRATSAPCACRAPLDTDPVHCPRPISPQCCARTWASTTAGPSTTFSFPGSGTAC